MTNNQDVQNEDTEYVCGECGAKVSKDDKVCPKCGGDISEIEGQKPASENELKRSKRYPALRTIASAYRALAWVVAIIAIIVFLIGLKELFGNRISIGGPLLLYSIIGGGVGVLSFLATSESIKVFIDIEANTRRTADSLEGKKENRE
jgi:predicted ATP-dependent serine protease